MSNNELYRLRERRQDVDQPCMIGATSSATRSA